jgi:hypothetical protein
MGRIARFQLACVIAKGGSFTRRPLRFTPDGNDSAELSHRATDWVGNGSKPRPVADVENVARIGALRPLGAAAIAGVTQTMIAYGVIAKEPRTIAKDEPRMRRWVGGKRMAKLKILFATNCAAILMGFANLAGSNILEPAPAGSGYDLVAHVMNTPTYGYNPEVPTDAAALGLRLARQYCRGPQVVCQRIINHEIYGITSEKPDYLVFVRCAG